MSKDDTRNKVKSGITRLLTFLKMKCTHPDEKKNHFGSLVSPLFLKRYLTNFTIRKSFNNYTMLIATSLKIC